MTAVVDHRKWHLLDSFIFFIRIIWISYEIYEISITETGMEKWVLFVWAISAFLVPYLFYRPGYIQFRYYLIAETLLTGSLFIYLASQYQVVEMYGFLILPMITIAYACQVKPLIWIGPIVFVSIFFVGTWVGNLLNNWDALFVFVDAALFYGIGASLGRMTLVNNANKKLIASIEEKNRDLEYYAKTVEELTIKEERNRVSQELHDTVGHIFTSVITSLDALPYLYRADKEEAEKSIKEISNLARNGLEDVRKTIHQMSPIDNQPLVESIQNLIADFRKHTATNVEVTIQGEAIEVGERIKHTIIRCIQEGLTNAKKHGDATLIKVNITFEDQKLIVLIEDNGKGCQELKLGFGLHTMKDRISSLAGTISFSSKLNSGMRIMCSIPLVKGVGMS